MLTIDFKSLFYFACAMIVFGMATMAFDSDTECTSVQPNVPPLLKAQTDAAARATSNTSIPTPNLPRILP